MTWGDVVWEGGPHDGLQQTFLDPHDQIDRDDVFRTREIVWNPTGLCQDVDDAADTYCERDSETIYGTALPYGPDEPARSIVEVCWSPEVGDVQIVTKCVRADDGTDYVPRLEPIGVLPAVVPAFGPVLPLTDVLDELRESHSQVLEQGAQLGELLEAEGPARSGFYIDLDRQGLNKLIRVLRHARNQTYGADE